jgi:hypothetical protein
MHVVIQAAAAESLARRKDRDINLSSHAEHLVGQDVVSVDARYPERRVRPDDTSTDSLVVTIFGARAFSSHALERRD